MLTFSLLGTASCNNGPPAFTQGIRDIADETLSTIPLDTFPVPNVVDSGTAANGGSNNGIQSFEGVTSSFGIDDHPAAAVQTNWTVIFNYHSAIPVCGSGTTSNFVPNSGGVFTAVCVVDLGVIQ